MTREQWREVWDFFVLAAQLTILVVASAALVGGWFGIALTVFRWAS